MEQWKTAFKQIFGKTPTKKDFSMAPSSVRGTLPVTPQKPKQKHGRLSVDDGPQLTDSCKRKMLVLKPNTELDEEFCSPVKKRPLFKVANNTSLAVTPTLTQQLSNGTDTENCAQDQKVLKEHQDDQLATHLLRRPTNSADPSMEDISFCSPVKRWQHFVSSPTQSAQKRQRRLWMLRSPNSLLKTPSPTKLLNRPLIHTNAGYLLTPEKHLTSSSMEVQEEEEDENDDADQPTERLEQNDEHKNDEVQHKPDEIKKKKKNTKPKMPKADKPNYVAINLRRRRFAPINKFRGKKWKKGANRRDCWNNNNFKRMGRR